MQICLQAPDSIALGLDKADITPVSRNDDTSGTSVSQGVPQPCCNGSQDLPNALQTSEHRVAQAGLTRDDTIPLTASHSPGTISSVDASKPSSQNGAPNSALTATVDTITTDVGSASASDQAVACVNITAERRETSRPFPILPLPNGKGQVGNECVQCSEREEGSALQNNPFGIGSNELDSENSSLTSLDDFSVNPAPSDEEDVSSDDEIIVKTAYIPAEPTPFTGATAHRKRSSSVLASKPGLMTKRKSQSTSRNTPRKPKRLKLPMESSISAMKECAPLPDDIISSEMISREISDALQTYDAQLIWLVTRLFYAIASPEAFSQLRDACTSARNSEGPRLSTRDEHISYSMRALDELDMATCATSIVRRYHLVKLVEFREARQAYHMQRDADRPPVVLKYGHIRLRSRKPNEGQGRALSSALRDILVEAHPRLQQIPENEASSHDEYQRKNSILKRRLGCARNWYALEQRFSRSVLALVPVGGLFDIHNHDVERLSKEAFSVLLDLLDKHRGQFLRQMGGFMLEKIFDILLHRDSAPHYQFENDRTIDLQSERYDSPSLLAICDTVS